MNEKLTFGDTDRAAIIGVVGTFRVNAPISIDDVRFATAVDGHSLSHMSGSQISTVLRTRCNPVPGRDYRHHLWIRRW